MRVQVIFALTEDELAGVITTSAKLGFMRKDPRRPWRHEEYKEAVRFVAQHLMRGAAGHSKCNCRPGYASNDPNCLQHGTIR